MLPTTATTTLPSILDVLPEVLAPGINAIIGDYLNTDKDYSLAATPLDFDEHGTVVDNATRRVTKEALMSSDCAREIIECIIRNANTEAEKQALNDLFQEIRQAGYVINLSGVDLVNREVSYGTARLDLTGLNFSGACLCGAQIGRAEMSGVDLTGADLSNAQLMDVNLVGADLSGACFKNTWLVVADLRKAKTDGINWSEFTCYNVQWPEQLADKFGS